jgi:biotin carboxyl carrier protein
MKYFIEIAGDMHEADIRREDGTWKVIWDGKEARIDNFVQKGMQIDFILNSTPVSCSAVIRGDHADIQLNQTFYKVRISRSKGTAGKGLAEMEYREETIRAPMPGLVVSVRAEEGGTVKQGDAIVILEAMKMENELRSPVGGRIREVCITEGSKVEKGEILAVIERI